MIHDVCADGPDHYLGHEQTLRLMNTEYYYPHTADRATRADWEAGGSLDMRERARQQARETLRTRYPAPLPAAVEAELRQTFNILLPKDVMQPAANLANMTNHGGSSPKKAWGGHRAARGGRPMLFLGFSPYSTFR